MKKIFVITLLLLFVLQAQALTAGEYLRGNAYLGSQNERLDKFYLHLLDFDNSGGVASKGTGKTFYVDSNVTNEGDGTSWTRAKDTLDEAINLCEASRGDFIEVAQGHAETLTGADAVDADVIGITIRGIGNGSLEPTFTFLLLADEFVIGADNVALTNLRFEVSSTSIGSVIDIQDGVDYASITKCVFTAVDAADGAVNFINLVNNNTGCVIEGNTFDSKAGGAAESAIMMDADTDQTVIRGNVIQGDYSVACIEGDTTLSTELLIDGNLLINGSSDSLIAQPAIDLLTGTTGYIINNYLVCNVATLPAAMETADAVMLFNNWYNEDVGSTKAGSPWHVGTFGGSLMDSVSASGDD